MALAASRHSWKQLNRSWVYRADASRCLCAVDRDTGRRDHHTLSQNTATAALSLRIYSSEDCPLCDGLKDKLEALRERGKFQQDIWANMEIEVRPFPQAAQVFNR